MVAMVMAVGCEDMIEEFETADNSLDTQVQEGDTFVTLKLTMESDSDDTQTRVEVNDVYESKWEQGDVVYLVEDGEDTSGAYVTMTYDSSSELFTGTANSGKTYRAFYTGGSDTIYPFVDNGVQQLGIDFSAAPLKPKMVSSGTITIENSNLTDPELEDLEQDYELFMQNITAMVTFDLTFNTDVLLTGVDITTLTISDITLGGSEVGETQIQTFCNVDRTKDVDSDEFYTETSPLYNATLIGTGGTATQDSGSGSKYTYSVTIHSLPFTIKAGESLPITCTISDGGSK